jgi:KDO2-lipid IV(A) lauroyltransferase
LNELSKTRPAREPADTPPPDAGFLMRLEYWGFLLVAGIARALPLDTTSAVSGKIWRLLAPRLRRHARARANLAASLPEIPEARREEMLLDMWENLGRTFGEAFHMDRIWQDTGRFAIHHQPEALAAVRAGGVVVVGLHQGNWEIASMVGLREGLNVAGVYQRLKNPLVDRYITRMRAPYYPAGLYSKGHEAVLKLMRVLKSGGGIGVLGDLREHKGIEVPFFGRMAPSTPFPALMARTLNIPLVAAQVIRLEGAHFTLRTVIVPVPRTSDKDADVLAGTAALQAQFETWIREHPEQWMWAHRRWAR